MRPDIYLEPCEWRRWVRMMVTENVITFIVRYRLINIVMIQLTTLRRAHSRQFSITEFLVWTKSYLHVPPVTGGSRVALVQGGVGTSGPTIPPCPRQLLRVQLWGAHVLRECICCSRSYSLYLLSGSLGLVLFIPCRFLGPLLFGTPLHQPPSRLRPCPQWFELPLSS